MASAAPPRLERPHGRFRAASPVGDPAGGRRSATGSATGSARRQAGRHTLTTALLTGLDLVGAGVAVAGAGAGAGLDGHRAAVLAAYPVLVAAARFRPRVRLCLRVGDELGRVALAAALPALALVVLVPAVTALRLAGAAAVGLLAARALAYALLRAARRRGVLVDAALVVGAGEAGVLVATTLLDHPELGASPVGLVDTLPPPDPLPVPLLGATAALPELVARTGASRVIVSVTVEADRDLVPVLQACRSLRVDVCLVPRLAQLGVAVPRSALDEVWGIPLVPLRRGAEAPGAAACKRVVDVVLATLALVVLAPVLAVLAVALRLRHGRPVLFRQLRVTGPQRTSEVLKLRTLAPQEAPDTTWTPVDAPRGLPGWLRRHHLDELPQLWNVLRGDLSLVGPRPERPFFAEQFAEEIEGYAARTRVPAGLTGWAQVHGLHGDTPLTERARFDNAFIEWWTPLSDLVVLARTLALAARLASRPSARRAR